MSNEVLLTVGIPCYNEEKYLASTLDSIIGQIFKDFIVYLCDDCSTDKSVEIAEKYAIQDNRIKILSANEKTNFVENWKKSLDVSETKYFIWVGAHDVLHEKYFQDSIEFLEANPQAAMIYPMAISIDANGNFGDQADSDIVTVGMNQNTALIKVASNLNYCTAIHGVFRSDVLKKLPVKHVVGFDFLVLVLTSVYGEIAKTEKVRFYRRIVRKESFDEAEKRWKTVGMYEDSKYSNFSKLIHECLIFYKAKASASFIEKWRTIFLLINKLSSKFNVKREEIYRQLLNL